MQYYEKCLKMQQHEWKVINFLEGRDKPAWADLIPRVMDKGGSAP